MFELVLIIISYILFALAPLFVGQLGAEGLGPFSIVFYRFLIASVFDLVITLVAIQRLQKKLNALGVTKSFWGVMKETFRNYFNSKDPQFFNGRSELGYLILFGILASNLNNIFYYFSFDLIGVALSTVIINGCSIIFIAIVDIWKKEETFNLLKGAYIGMLLAAIFTIAFSQSANSQISMNAVGPLMAVLATVCLILFTLGISKDTIMQRKPLFDQIRVKLLPEPDELERSALLLRSNFKNLATHFFGAISVIPFALIWWGISPNSLMGTSAATFLFTDLANFLQVLQSGPLLLFIIVGTTIPYFMLYYAASVWPKEKYGRYDMWVSVSRMLQPLIGLYIGFFIWQENIRIDYIIFTTIFLAATIIIRYFDEIGNLKPGVFVIKLNVPHNNQGLLDFLITIKEVEEINFLTGTFDVIVICSIKSMNRLIEIQEKIKSCPFVKSIFYSISKSIDFKHVNPNSIQMALIGEK